MSKAQETLRGYLPADLASGRYFVNAIGSTAREASVNLSSIELSDAEAARIEFLPVEIHIVGRTEAGNG